MRGKELGYQAAELIRIMSSLVHPVRLAAVGRVEGGRVEWGRPGAGV